jgi:hypothetical protein
MSSPSADAPESSLIRHVQTLYPLARVLAGSEEATSLIEDVYTHAADVPPAERPSDERGWLFGLMIDRRDGNLHPAGAEVHPGAETSFTDDPFRREVAAQTAERMLPVAFAACSIHERVILAIDVLASPSDEVLAVALDTTATNARSVRDRARSALRASLRDILNGPERMLVDVALPDEALRTHLRTLLEDRFQPTPSSLRSTVRDIVERARAERAAARSDASAPEASSPSSIQQWLSVRSLLGALALLSVVAAGIAGWTYFFPSSPASTSSSQSVVALSAQQAPNVTTTQPTSDPAAASAYIRKTWSRLVSVPSIDGASLQGVGRLRVGSDVTVPVLLYADPSAEARIALYAFNYALLDRLGPQGTLDRTIRSKLATNRTLLNEEHGSRSVVLWRQQDDILVAVAPHLEPSALRSRIQL